MFVIIEKNHFKIQIHNKINEISDDNLIEIFCLVHAFKILETQNGNEYEKAWIKLKYVKNIVISEYINIFKLIRAPSLYDFIFYFKTINETFNQQELDTKLELNDYLEQTEHISQEILIVMLFNIKTNKEEINKKKQILIDLMRITNTDKEIFKIIEKDKFNSKLQ